MSVQFWNAVLALYDEIDRAPIASPQQPTNDGDSVNGQQQALRASIKLRLGALTAELGSGTVVTDLQQAACRSDEQGRLLQALIYACDERVMHRLSAADRLRWPLLQYELLAVRNGGERFYQLVEMAIATTSAETLLLEVLYFCSVNGFVGGLFGDDDAILAERARLRERLAAAQPSADDSSGSSAQTTSTSIKPIIYYLGATAVTLLGVIGLTLLTNLL